MVVDAAALIAILRRAPGAERLLEKLLAAAEVRISAGSLIKARLIAEADGGAAELEGLLDAEGVEVVAVDARQAKIAAAGFRRFGTARHRAGLAFADLFAYALARALDEPLLSAGAGWGQTDVKVG